MYISELKIQGFKSFVKKTSLKFGEGITAVVGPNGCGKTNIVDAIRWVLGEQKTSVLRGGKLEDVIFNGAEGLKPLGMCEVSLTVHNNKGKLPIEYNDVEITRRAFRDGESEYFINRTPCRLKDIHDLFMDTGMGADAYSVIELGMIESILSETRDDRKRMFEEAAGINKYKLERRSARRKFEVVRQDLDRINDIIREVDHQVHGLALQLKRFKRHAKLVEKLKEKELALAFLRINYYQGLAKPLSDRITELHHLRESNLSDENKKEVELDRLKKIFRSQREEVDQVQRNLAEIEVEREESANSILLCTEQKRSAEKNIERLLIESTSLDTKQIQSQERIKNLEAEINQLDPEIERQLESYRQFKLDYEEADKTYLNVRRQVENQQTERWQQQQKISESQSLFKRTEQLLTDHQNRSVILAEQRQELEEQQTSDLADQKRLEEQKLRLALAHSDAGKAFENCENQLAQLSDRQRELSDRILLEKGQITTLESQHRFYQEMVEKNEGYPDGARFILDNRAEYPSALGSLGELITTDEEHSSVVENFLGTLAYCLVVPNRAAALDILEHIDRQNKGRISLIPLEEVSAIAHRPKPVPKSATRCLRTIDLVKIKTELKPLTDYLFGNLLLVEDLKSALADEALAGWNLIDHKGVLAGADNILKKSRLTGETGIIGRDQKLKDLQQAIAAANSELAQLSSDQERINQKIDTQKQSQIDLQIELDDHTESITAIDKDLIRCHYSQSQILESLQENSQQIKELQEQIGQSKTALEELIPQIDENQAKLEKIVATSEKLAEQLEVDRLLRDKLNSSVQDARIESLNLENKRENRLFQQRTAEETIAELLRRKEEIKVEITEIEAELVDLDDRNLKSETALKSINSKLKQQRSILDLKQKVFDETYQTIDDLEQRIRNEQRNREALLEELRECEVKAAGYNQQITTVRELIREKYTSEVAAEAIVDESIEELTIEVERIQRSIDAIGPINMAVQLEYEEEQQRLELLREQREDLVASEENLQETIKKIDRVARKQFLDTFTAIKENFTRLFSMFFEGGEGTLSLVGDPDPLEAGIAIFAQPPGKRNQTLRILSAGEKALTAIALLFSIYQVKPSPYCILDEVDAPLDDVNIKKFSRILRKFSDETQFIVVTHNKLTMEATNYLYGITMERKGVSKLVSVKFDD